jgi:hypothetical protein
VQMIEIAGFPSRSDETEDRDQGKKGEKDRRCGPIEMLDHRRSPKYAARMQRAETGMSASWAQKKNGKAKSVGSMELYSGTARARAQGRPSSASFIHALLMKSRPSCAHEAVSAGHPPARTMTAGEGRR